MSNAAAATAIERPRVRSLFQPRARNPPTMAAAAGYTGSTYRSSLFLDIEKKITITAIQISSSVPWGFSVSEPGWDDGGEISDLIFGGFFRFHSNLSCSQIAR